MDSILGAEVSSRSPEAGAAGAHVVFGGHASRERRHLLLPVLHAIQGRAGWLSRAALDYVARRLELPPAEIFGVASFYHWFSLDERPPVVAHVCDDVTCRVRGAEKLCERLSAELGPEGKPCLDGRATWHRSPCLGQCERPPAALVVSSGQRPVSFALTSVAEPRPLVLALRKAAVARTAGA
ncbi:NAD(P)H-dependent oxidoreductase subunit E, partial [bacterium]|nr:NAD(P)H-dependent oxidoreductase subunit E [bacterium]